MFKQIPRADAKDAQRLNPALPAAAAAQPSSAVATDTCETRDAGSSIALWNGFSLTWGYNHRLNRIGSQVDNGVQPPRAMASAASGSGPDRAVVQTHAVYVELPGAAVDEGVARFRLSGSEGQPLHGVTRVVVPGDGTIMNAYAVLQGFDTYATDSADKLVALALEVSQPQRLSTGWQIDVSASITLDCSTAECPADDSVEQVVEVRWALIRSAEHRAEPMRVEHTSAWGSRGGGGGGLRESLPLTAQPGGFVGLRRVAFVLSDEMHMLAMTSAVHVDPVNAGWQLTQGFDNWRDGMRGSTWPWSWFSFRQAGAARVETELLLFSGPAGKPATALTTIDWTGFGASAVTPRAQGSAPLLAPAPR